MESSMLNQDTIMGIDAITFLIIAIIAVIFIMALVSQIGYVISERKRRKPFDKIKRILSQKDVVVLEEESAEMKQWLSQSLQFDLIEQRLVAERDARGFKTVVPIHQLLCSEPNINGKGIPALLTSIGVAGTFLGITLGLSDFNFSDVGENSASLLQSAVVLLEGMKTAFYTSLAGMATSAIFMIVIQIHEKFQRRQTRKLNAHLANLLHEVSPTYYLQKLVAQTDNQEQFNAQQESAQAMQNVSQQLATFLNQFEELGNNFNGEKMAGQIADAVDRTMKDSVAPILIDFKEELKAVREFKEDNSEALLTQLVATIKQELIEPVTSELKHTSDAVNTSNELSRQLNENVALVLKQVGKTVETIDNFNQETMQKLQAFAQSLREVLEGFKADTEGTMTRITGEVQNVLDMSVKGMTAQREAFDESAQRAATAFEGMGQKLEDALDKRALSEKALFTATEQRIETLLEQTNTSFEEQNSVLKQTGIEASSLMESARVELEQGLGNIDEKVTGMSRTVQKELESFREQYQDNLTQFFTQQNNLLEDTLGKQRDNLVEVVDKFKQVFTEEYQTRHNLLQELTVQHEQLQSSATTIQKLAKAIGLTETATMSELQDIANTIGRHAGDLKKEYIMASSAFKEITEGLPKAMEQYFKEANQSTELFFRSFDDAAGRIHNRLAQAADFLVDAKLQDMSYDKSEIA